jgi:uncharacterized protein GlcG (DUF336 family)
MLSLLKARKIVDQAILRARELGLNISVAVCDGAGRLIAFNQMDRSCGWESDRCAMGKAVAAAIAGLPSDQLGEHIQRLGMRSMSHTNVVPPRNQRGGLPVFISGIVQGGCGVSGGATTDQDEDCAMAGIAALNEPRTEPSTFLVKRLRTRIRHNNKRSPSAQSASKP